MCFWCFANQRQFELWCWSSSSWRRRLKHSVLFAVKLKCQYKTVVNLLAPSYLCWYSFQIEFHCQRELFEWSSWPWYLQLSRSDLSGEKRTSRNNQVCSQSHFVWLIPEEAFWRDWSCPSIRETWLVKFELRVAVLFFMVASSPSIRETCVVKLVLTVFSELFKSEEK